MAYRYSYSPMFFIGGLINFFLFLVESILLLRVILRLFSANPNATFVHWVYETSATLMAPFRGIFPVTTIHPGGFVLDLPALFAMIVYAILAYVILGLLSLVPVPGAGSDDGAVTATRRTARG